MSSLFGEESWAGFAQVVVERGIDRYPHGLTYGIPPELADLAAGDRVHVPLGRGDADTPGYVVEIATTTGLEQSKIKPIRSRDPSATSLPGTLLDLARWMSGYYCTPLGMVLTTMLPGPVRRNVGAVSRSMIDFSGSPPATQGIEEVEKKTAKPTPKQRQVLQALEELPTHRRPIEIRTLATLADIKTVGPIRRLIERGVLSESRRSSVEAVWAERSADSFIPESLTAQQEAVIRSISGDLAGGFSPHLLFGVTGSGKTEVYIRLIDQVVAAGRTALLLVPEISLTPQTGGRLVGRFPNHRVAILHSGLTAAQRHQQWAMVAAGDADIVLGARSAVFAPIPEGRLGLIIVDEEHDGSYKQDQLPRYHGRDVAVRRGQLAGCPVLLGSATPSLESWYNATERGVYRLHRMPQRVPGASLPKVTVVDFREQMKQRDDRGVHLIGPLLEAGIGRTLESGYQVLLLLNRRGYANYIACPDHGCGWLMNCEDCDATMVFHKHRSLPAGGFVRCHHCGSEQRLPPSCPLCGRKVVTFGLGTQRVEEELERKFPVLAKEGSLLRMDSDTMHTAGHYHEALTRFGRGDARLLVGTQMIAKGLDVPGVRLVGVINADTAINLPDFRAAERTFQLVNQVAGRTGRADSAGRVIVQSFQPHADPIRLAAEHDFETFARQEIAGRAQYGLPPITRMARIVVRDREMAEAVSVARRIADGLRAIEDLPLRVRGPMPCPISRIAGFHRQQIELLCPTAGDLQRALTSARNAGLVKSDAQTAVDVDPIALL